MERAALTIYLIVLVLSPLLFGAVHTYAYTLMALGILTGSLLLVIKSIRKDFKTGVYQFHLPKTSLNLLFVILLLFLFFQFIPLPEFIIKLLSPGAMVIKQKSIPATMAIDSAKEMRDWFALSPYYYPVRISIIRWMIYGLFFLGLSQLLNSRKRIELILFLILMTCCFEALYGLFETFSASNHIWWFKKIVGKKAVTGTYINRNHLAGLLEMGLLLAVSYSTALAERKRRRIIPGHKTSLRVRLSRFLSGEQRLNKRSLILFSGVVMGIGLIFSASRGGMIATAAAMLSMGILFIVRGGHRRKGVILLLLFLITATYALHIGIEYPLGRFESFEIGFENRTRLAQRTLEMYEDYRLTGVGVGNFRYAYPRYQPEQVHKFVQHAHNDWVQFLAEVGIMGFFLFLVGISYYLYRTFKLWRRRGDPFAVCLGIAPILVMTALAIHSYSDFNLHIPANFLMLVAIMAIGYSALHLENRHGREKTLYRNYVTPLKYKGIVFLILVLGLMVWTGLWTVRHFMAEAYCNTVHNSTLNRDRNPPLEEIRAAIGWDRWNAGYWFKEARELMRIRDEIKLTRIQESEDRRQKIQMEIIEALEEAVKMNPFEARYHMELGWGYTYLWRLMGYDKKWLSAADISIDRAAYFAGDKSPDMHVHLGNYWVIRSKTIDPSNPEWEASWAKIAWHYKKAQSLTRGKRLLDSIMRFVWEYYPDTEFVKKVIPDNYPVVPIQ